MPGKLALRPFHTFGGVRPKCDDWDGPHFRLFQCGADLDHAPKAPHALFMDAMEAEGTWLYVLQGEVYYGFGDDRYRIEAGQALITRRPDPGWLIRPGKKLPLNTLWIHVIGEPAMRLFDFLHMKYGQIQVLPLQSPAVKLARQLIRLAATESVRPAHFWSEKTFQWMNAWWQAVQATHRPANRVLLQVPQPSRLISYAPRTVKNFAAEMGYSRSYLTRKLGRQWGKSPGKVLRQVRLDEAARLLRTTKLSVRDIAKKVGYSTTAAFSRAFVRQLGIPPLPYRQNHR